MKKSENTKRLSIVEMEQLKETLTELQSDTIKVLQSLSKAIMSKSMQYKNYWTPTAVSKILSDERYTGKMIYQKTKRKPGNTFKRIKTPQNEWVCIDNMFEAIISTEDFQAVQDMKRVRKNSGHISVPNLFSGVTIRCGICKMAMTERNKNGFYKCYSNPT